MGFFTVNSYNEQATNKVVTQSPLCEIVILCLILDDIPVVAVFCRGRQSWRDYSWFNNSLTFIANASFISTCDIKTPCGHPCNNNLSKFVLECVIHISIWNRMVSMLKYIFNTC